MRCSRFGSPRWLRRRARRCSTTLPQALCLGIGLLGAPAVVAQPADPAPLDERAGEDDRPRLSDSAEVSRAASLYDSSQLEHCVVAFEDLLTPGARMLTEPEPIERARVYLAACLIGVGELERSEEVFAEAIRANPQMRPPDSLVFPPEVIDVFLRVRESLLEEIRKAAARKLEEAERQRAERQQRREAELLRLRELERLASQETVVVRNSRWIAAIPFGVGQFQNGDTGLGWAFLATEAVLGAVVIGGLAVELQNYALLEPRAGEPAPSRADITNNTDIARNVWTVGLYALGAVALGGIVEAQLSFEPEVVSVRRRELPPELRRPPEARLRWQPTITTGEQGTVIGVGGTF